MHPKSPKWLEDIVDSCTYILSEVEGIDVNVYAADRRRRFAIERNFEIIGEAILRIERVDPATAGRISDYRQIIGFRNRLVHGYDTTDLQQVWEMIQVFLPVLQREAEQLLIGELD